MPNIKFYCDIDADSGDSKDPHYEEYKFTFCREETVDAKDLGTFYRAVRNFFRQTLTTAEREQSLEYVKHPKFRRQLKQKKNLALRDVFKRDYWIEGVDKVGPNKYKILWGT